MLHGTANYLLKKLYLNSYTLLSTISPCLARQFLKRNKEFFKKKPKPLAIEQKNIYNSEDFTAYFE